MATNRWSVPLLSGRDVDMEVAQRVTLEGLPGLFTLHHWHAAHAVALQAALQEHDGTRQPRLGKWNRRGS